MFAVLGVGLMLVVGNLPIRLWPAMTPLMLGGIFVLLLLVLIPGVGVERGGAARWLRLGPVMAQPSELAKLVLVVFLAARLARLGPAVRDFRDGLLPSLAVPAGMAVLVLAERDLGATVVVVAVSLTMLYTAGARLNHLVPLMATAIPVVLVATVTVPYRVRRLMAFRDPWADPSDSGYHIIQSWLAFRSGGVFGQGIGDGIQKLYYLPEAHTDFVFSVLAEEIGLLGVMLVTLLLAVLVWRGLRIAHRAPNHLARNLGVGLSLLLGLQTMVNLWVVVGLMPTKGSTLPFLSYGGSSLLVCLFSVGVLLAISVESTGVHNRRGGDPGRPKRARRVDASNLTTPRPVVRPNLGGGR